MTSEHCSENGSSHSILMEQRQLHSRLNEFIRNRQQCRSPTTCARGKCEGAGRHFGRTSPTGRRCGPCSGVCNIFDTKALLTVQFHHLWNSELDFLIKLLPLWLAFKRLLLLRHFFLNIAIISEFI